MAAMLMDASPNEMWLWRRYLTYTCEVPFLLGSQCVIVMSDVTLHKGNVHVRIFSHPKGAFSILFSTYVNVVLNYIWCNEIC